MTTWIVEVCGSSGWKQAGGAHATQDSAAEAAEKLRSQGWGTSSIRLAKAPTLALVKQEA